METIEAEKKAAPGHEVSTQSAAEQNADIVQDQRIKEKADRRRAVLRAVGDFQRARRREYSE